MSTKIFLKNIFGVGVFFNKKTRLFEAEIAGHLASKRSFADIERMVKNFHVETVVVTGSKVFFENAIRGWSYGVVVGTSKEAWSLRRPSYKLIVHIQVRKDGKIMLVQKNASDVYLGSKRDAALLSAQDKRIDAERRALRLLKGKYKTVESCMNEDSHGNSKF